MCLNSDFEEINNELFGITHLDWTWFYLYSRFSVRIIISEAFEMVIQNTNMFLSIVHHSRLINTNTQSSNLKCLQSLS